MAGSNNPWSYTPSPAAAILFLILFALLIIWHTFTIFTRRVWYFIPLVLGGCFETIGYMFRYLGGRDLSNLTYFILQTLLILVAPALFAASIYMVLGRLIRLVRAESYSSIRPSWLTKIFVGGDILSFIVQLAGSGLLSSNFSLGKTIIILGLAAQLVFMGVFAATAAVFHWRLARAPTPMSQRLDMRGTGRGWRTVMISLYTSSGLIFVRSIFRLVEFTGSNHSAMMTSEAYLYVCDSVMMVGVLAMLGWFSPAEYIGNTKKMTGMQDEELL